MRGQYPLTASAKHVGYGRGMSEVITVAIVKCKPGQEETLEAARKFVAELSAAALPPGLAVFVASPAALAKAATIKTRGYYFDLLEFEKNAADNMTPSTPAIPLIYALESKLGEFFAEGLEARYARHSATNQQLKDWAAGHGFTLFPEAGFESRTLVCVNNGAKPGGRVIDVAILQKRVKDRGILIDGGYGKIKGTTFRISNMGDETPASIAALVGILDESRAGL